MPLILRVLQSAEKGGENFEAVPEILEADVFVGGVLVVVVVRDGEGDDRDVVAVLEKIHRKAAAGGGQEDGIVTGGGHDGGELAREGESEVRARCRIAGAPFDFYVLRFREPSRAIRRLANDRIALRF